MATRWSSFEGEHFSVRTGLTDQKHCKLCSEFEQFIHSGLEKRTYLADLTQISHT